MSNCRPSRQRMNTKCSLIDYLIYAITSIFLIIVIYCPNVLQSWADSWAVGRATGQAQWTLFITLTGKLSQLHFIIAVAGNWKSAHRVGKRQRRIHNLNVIIRKSQIRFVLVFGGFCEERKHSYSPCLKVSLLVLVQQKNSSQECPPFSKEYSSATNC